MPFKNCYSLTCKYERNNLSNGFFKAIELPFPPHPLHCKIRFVLPSGAVLQRTESPLVAGPALPVRACVRGGGG